MSPETAPGDVPTATFEALTNRPCSFIEPPPVLVMTQSSLAAVFGRYKVGVAILSRFSSSSRVVLPYLPVLYCVVLQKFSTSESLILIG